MPEFFFILKFFVSCDGFSDRQVLGRAFQDQHPSSSVSTSGHKETFDPQTLGDRNSWPTSETLRQVLPTVGKGSRNSDPLSAEASSVREERVRASCPDRKSENSGSLPGRISSGEAAKQLCLTLELWAFVKHSSLLQF